MNPSNSSDISHNSVVNTLSTNVERLIADHLRLVGLVRELRGECDRLKEERRERLEQISQLQHDLAKSNLAATLSGADGLGDRRQAKAYVNRLMREVDACIALLSTAVDEGDEEK